MISIDGAVPTIETFENGTYRYAKVFHVILRQQPGAAAKSFMEFLHSADGVRALREAGCLPGAE